MMKPPRVRLLLTQLLALIITFFPPVLAAKATGRTPPLSPSPTPRCSLADGTNANRTVLLASGSEEDFVDLHFVVDPAEKISDIYFVHRSSNDLVCSTEGDASCVDMSPLILDSDSRISNATLAFEFTGLPGVINYSLVVYNKSDASTMICSIHLHIVVAGTILYRGDLNENAYPDIWSNKVGTAAKSIEYTELLKNSMLQLNVFSQFLDGTNSTSALLSQPGLSDIRILPYIYARQVNYDVDVCDSKGLMVNSSFSMSAECGIAFGSEQLPSNADQFFPSYPTSDVRLGLQFNPYRVGSLGIRFDWPAFTDSHNDIDALHYFILEINVIGSPPPVIVDLSPKTSFASRGGDMVTIKAFNTLQLSAMELVVEKVTQPFPLVKDTRRKDDSGFYEIIEFIVTKGSGSGLPWELHARGPGGDVVGVDIMNPVVMISYYLLDLFEVTPVRGLPAGGIPMVLTGHFEFFNRSTDDVLFTNTAIPKNLLIFSSHDRIEFTLPSRLSIGPTHNHDIRVSVGPHRSNAVEFDYFADPIDVTILAVGASFDSAEDVYVIGRCSGSQYQVIVAPGILIAHYHWKLIDQQSGQDLLSSEHRQNDALIELGADALAEGSYVLYVEVQSEGGSPGGHFISIRKSSFEQLGVSLYQPSPRTLSFPNAALRIHSFIELPGRCYEGSSRMTFEWTYQKKIYSFSYENGTRSDNLISPLKLGREFMISKTELVPGVTSITLRAYMTDHPEVYGSATTFVRVEKGPLVAVIGKGLSSTSISVNTRYIVSGLESYDSANDSNYGLAYSWECEASPDHRFDMKIECPDWAQVSVSIGAFHLPSTSLQETSKQGVAAMRYRLRVSKDNRVSEQKQIVLLLVASQQLDPISIEVTNNRGERVDTSNIKYFEDTIFTVAGPENLVWKYEVIAPSWDADSILTTPGNVISASGFWQPVRLSREPLGMVRGAFSPGATYTIAVKYFQIGKLIGNEITIDISVMETPLLIFPEIPISVGTPETVFSVTALTSYISPFFSFYFFLVGNDGSEVCVGGCSGTQTQSFRIVRDGEYRVICRLFDSQGEQLLGESLNQRSITVMNSANPDALKAQSLNIKEPASRLATRSSSRKEETEEYYVDLTGTWNMMTDFYESGNHAAFEGNAFDIAKIFNKKGVSTQEEIMFLGDIISKLERITSNSMPNSLAGQNTVNIVAEFSRLSYAFVVDEETIYNLLRIIVLVLENSPTSERLWISDGVRRIFNYTRGHSLNLGAAGTSRNIEERQIGKVNNLMLDLYELQATLLLGATTRSEMCGFETQISTVVDDGRPNEGSLDHSVMSAYIPCSPDQDSVLKAEHSSLSWNCNDIFDFKGTKRYAMLIETPDFVLHSGVQGRNSSDSLRLTWASIMQADSKGNLENIDHFSSSCYDIGIEMDHDNDTSNSLAPVVYRMSPHKAIGQKMEEFGGYHSAFADIQKLRNDGAKSIEFRTGTLGLFGALLGRRGIPPGNAAEQGQGQSSASTLRSVTGRMVGLMLLIVGILAAAFLGLTSRSIQAQGGVYGHGGSVAAPIPDGYIERDIYGRSVVDPEFFSQNP